MAKSSTFLSSQRQKVKQWLSTLSRVLRTFLFISFAPILLLIYGFFCLYRLIVSKVARYFDPKLGKMVSALSSYFAAHDIYGNSYTINIALHVVGKVDRLHLIRAFENMLHKNVAQDGNPLYVELTQKIVTKFGYKFWKNVDNFQMDNHITYLNPANPNDPVSLSDIRDVIARFGKTPLNPHLSPWHVFIVKNFSSSENPAVKSAIIFRLHHALFDGFSVLNVFSKMADNELILAGKSDIGSPKPKPNTAYSSIKWVYVIFKAIVMFFRAPYELIGQSMSYDNNELMQTNRNQFKGVMRFHECEPMWVEELKAIKNFYGVSFSTLVTTLSTLALKRFMDNRKMDEEKIHLTFPLPVTNHPDKLRNYFSGGIISLDLNHDDRVKLLHEIDERYRQFRVASKYGLPEITMLVLRAIGCLPVFLTPRIDNVALGTTLMHSSFPGPIHTGYFCGFPVVDATVAGSISKPYPIGTLSYSYAGIYKFGLMADASIFTNQDEAKEMGDFLYKEFLAFSRQVKANMV